MKANVEFSKRAKNSLIYFQVGLIATMVVVLLLLEFNFMSKEKEVVVYTPTEPTFEKEYIYTPVVVKSPVQETKVETKVVKPVVKLPNDPVEIQVEEDEVVIPKQTISTENTNEFSNEESTTTASSNTPVDNNNTISTYNSVNVEQLPMFKACKGLPKSQQKDCFDEQLTKAIMKHLTYPDADRSARKQGMATIEFVINENGLITNIKSISNGRATPDMELAAKKALAKLPKLEPAKQGDTPVKIKYAIPIQFKLN